MLKSMHSQYDTIWTSRNPKEDALFYDRLSGGTHNPKGGHGGGGTAGPRTGCLVDNGS